ncbi:MAG TPA: ABC transporter substrate-binding protein [Psychromonas sp.]
MVQIAVPDIPVSFSPYVTPRLEEQYANLFFDPLLRWRDDQQIEPRLVEKWEKIAPGVTRFYLKRNIKFHSGNDLTSQDVIWTFAEIQQDPQAKLFFAGIDNITTQSTYSFIVRSQLAETQVLDYLTHFFVLDASFYGANKNKPIQGAEERLAGRNLYLSGTGPYLIGQYNPYTHLKAVKNQHYWGINESSLALNFLKIKSPKSRVFALLSSDVDISAGITPNMLNSIHFSKSKSAVHIASPAAMFLTINDRKTVAFKQKEAREAINLAINKAGTLKQSPDGSAIISSAFTRLEQADTPADKPYLPSYKVDKSLRYIRQSKLPKHLSLLVMIDAGGNSEKVANTFINMMLTIGIRLKMTTVSTLDDWKKQQFNHDFTLSPWQSTLIDNKNIYHDICADSYLADFIEYLFVESKAAGALNSREKIFELAKQEHKIIPLFFQNNIWAADNKYNLHEIFSANGSPYWDLLKRKE